MRTCTILTLASALLVSATAFSQEGDGDRLRPPTGPTLTMQAGPDQLFGTIFFSPDGKRLAGVTVAGHHGEPAIYVWDAATGKRLFTRSWHKKVALSVRFNDDGTLLVASAPLPSDKAGEVQLWDPVTGKSLRTLKGAEAGPVIFSPDGKLVTATGGQPASLGLWDVSTGKRILALDGNDGPITFSPDSKLLTGIDSGGRGHVWNAATGKLIQTLEGMFAGGDAFSPDSKRVAGGAGVLGVEVRVWEVASGRKLLELRDAHVKGVVSVAFTPDGKRLVTGGHRRHKPFLELFPAEKDGEVKIWDAKTGKELLAFRVTDLGGYLGCMCLAPDGQRVAVSPGSGSGGRVTIWTLPSTAPAKKMEERPEPTEMCPGPLPAEVVAAWQKAGAKFGWMRLNLVTIFMPPRPGLENEDGLVPAFSFAKWPEGKVGKLPQPERGFGLFLYMLQVSDKDLKELAGLKSLLALDLHGTHVTDAGLPDLAGLKSLRKLDLGGTTVTDQGLKELTGLKALRALSLRFNSEITDGGLKELAKLQALRQLDLSNSQVSDAGLKELAALKLLEELTLDSTPVRGVGFKELAGLKSLRELSLAAAAVTDAGLNGLAGMKSLRGLYLDATPVTDAGLKELAGLASLQRLGLSRTELTGAGVNELAGLKSLSYLDLSRTKIADAGLKAFAELKTLPYLNLSYTLVTDAGLKELAGMKALRDLELDHTQVTGAGLKELTGLEGLGLSDTPVSDEGLKGLVGMKSLRGLSLSNTKVTDSGLNELAGLTSLKQLNLDGTRVTAAGVHELKKKLPGLAVSHSRH